jgi:hypothetical protein
MGWYHREKLNICHTTVLHCVLNSVKKNKDLTVAITVAVD